MAQQNMAYNFHSSNNPDFIQLDHISRFRPSNEEISARVTYDYNPLETFSEANLFASSMQSYVTDSNDYSALDNIPLTKKSTNSVDEVCEYLKEGADVFYPIESNDRAHDFRNDDEQLDMIKANNESLPVIRSQTEKSSNPSILLSKCVAVTNSKPRPLKILYPLEDTYRARYKSDYFPQNGAVRRPRYIADNAYNHFITLEMPTEYHRDLTNEYVRVALITTFIGHHGHYYSPYKFQKDHNNINIPDENPLYIRVNIDGENNFTMRLHLVLIKSKLDQLNYVQPLKLFSDTPTPIQNIIHEERLTPKELIQKYQLDKSHIAFTMCTKLSDGSFKPHPETTTMSSVITETSGPRLINELTATPSDSNEKVCCPCCSRYFDLRITPQADGERKRKSNKQTSRSSTEISKTERPDNKKKNNA